MCRKRTFFFLHRGRQNAIKERRCCQLCMACSRKVEPLMWEVTELLSTADWWWLFHRGMTKGSITYIMGMNRENMSRRRCVSSRGDIWCLRKFNTLRAKEEFSLPTFMIICWLHWMLLTMISIFWTVWGFITSIFSGNWLRIILERTFMAIYGNIMPHQPDS